jgi:hypothetical protein
MTKKTRYFLAASAAVLVAGLGVGLVAYYGGGFPSLSASRSGPSELSYVPADATVVAFANVREVMDSELRRKLKEALPAEHEQGQQEFQNLTGIDIERDIQYVIAAMTSPDPRDGNGLVVARGTFNVAQLETLVRDHGGTVQEYKGKRLVICSAVKVENPDVPQMPEQHPLGHTMALAFLEPGLVAIGSETAIKSSIDAQLTAHSITSNDQMMELISEIERGNNTWAVGRFDAIAGHAKLPDEIRGRIPAITTFAVMTHIDGGVTGTLRAETRDEASAENLRDVVRGLVALGKLQSQNDPKVTAMLQSLQLTGTGKTVALSFAVPSEIIDMIPKAMHGVHDGAAARTPMPPVPPQPPAPPQPDK